MDRYCGQSCGEPGARAGAGCGGGSAGLEGGYSIWKSYQEASGRLESLAESTDSLKLLLVETDKAYSSLASSWGELAALRGVMESASTPVIEICSSVGPVYASIYLDVVRTEGALEFYTNAYTTGLQDVDITVVTLLTYVPEADLDPVERGFIVYVYTETLNLGGPGAFDNATAAQIAYKAAAAKIGETSLLQAYHQAWLQAVSQAPELKLFMAEDAKAGQVRLKAVVEDIAGQVTNAAARAVAEEAASRLPDNVKDAYSLYVDTLLSEGCTEEAAEKALQKAVAQVLLARGLPPEYGEALAAAFARGDYNSYLQTAALASAQLALAEANTTTLQPEDLASILTAYDPEASGAIASGEALDEALEALVSRVSGLPPEVAGLVVRGMVEEAAARLVLSNTPPQAIDIAEAVLKPTPPLTEEEALSRIRLYLQQQMILQGMPEDLAEKAASAAEEAWREGDEGAVVQRLVEEAAYEAAANVLEGFKGVLVEDDMEGFLIVYLGRGGYEEVKSASEDVKRLVDDALGTDSRVMLAGEEALRKELQDAVVEDLRRSDMASSIIVVAILAVVIGTILGVIIPFIGIGAGLTVALAILYFLASNDIVDVTSQSRAIVFTTGLGLGIDYSAYVTKKFRDNMRGSRGAWEAAGKAASQSVRPVLAGAFAAAAGFSSLMLAFEFPFVKSIGATVPIAILSVAVASLTLTPAILALVGWASVLWFPTCPYKSYQPGSRLFKGLVSTAGRAAPILLPILVVAGLAGVYYAATGFQGSFDIMISLPKGTGVYESMQHLLSEYDAPRLFPQYIVASTASIASTVADAADDLECVREAEADGRLVYVVLDTNPLNTEAVECVEQLRSRVKEVDPDSLVGGSAAINLDLRDYLYRAFYSRVIPAAALLVAAIISVFYGSIPAALSGVASILFAAAWSLSTVSLLSSQTGIEPPWFAPVLLAAALLGVGMDYISFYVNHAREAFLKGDGSRYYIEAASTGTGLVLGLAS
ncbi:MMPL family transporter [Aeropyrum camini]|uniref:MMPL family transporter n=1 Tax=Aeropyrum camini TaxID=229980 RepID=UPI000786EB07|nr:MMPL family transporter [Aeropyrum camini]